MIFQRGLASTAFAKHAGHRQSAPGAVDGASGGKSSHQQSPILHSNALAAFRTTFDSRFGRQEFDVEIARKALSGPFHSNRFRVKQMREQFDAVHDARAGAGEIRVRVHGINPLRCEPPEIPPSRAVAISKFETCSSAFSRLKPHGDKIMIFRRPFQQRRPRQMRTESVCLAAQSSMPPASSTISGTQWPAAIIRINPFHAENLRAAGNASFTCVGDSFQSRAARRR